MRIGTDNQISELFRLTPIQKDAAKKLRLKTVRDLLYYFPSRYGDTASATNIASLQKGDKAVVFGKINDLETAKGFKSKITMAQATIEDETGKISCVWFNQPYIAKMHTAGSFVRIEGKVSERREGGTLYFSNPKIEKVDRLPTGVGDSLFGDEAPDHSLYPVYAESRGLSSLWIYHAIQKIIKRGLLEDLPENIPADILAKYNLPGIRTAMIWIHAPQKSADALAARKRFSFEEIFLIQLGKNLARKEYQSNPAFAIETNPKNLQEFIRRFPFQATAAQNRAIETITKDMTSGQAMSRLLEGDVGSGKTAVAAATAYAVISWKQQKKNPKETSNLPSPASLQLMSNLPDSARLQVAYMCPTEILAGQHFESFIKYFAYLGVQVGLITSSGCRKFPSKVNPKGWTDISRNQLLSWVANGEIAVVIGTHSLIQKSVKFKHLAYVIIDEQHRFGTAQRAQLVKKNQSQNPSSAKSSPAPHLLSMTATPIPRTLALTMYGDLDLTLLDQSPDGRKPIITEIVTPDKRDWIYEKIRKELETGKQAYVICPRIDEPDPDKEQVLIAKSVKEEARRLKEKVFPEYKIGVLHGKMKPKEKDEVMDSFKNQIFDILCATSVVEVGVNVPNATVIVIEGAERFGLSQLHQLRGRVQRSSNQAYCYAFTETNSAKSAERLKALQTAKNGFELAELDLAQRGAGSLLGGKQWGISDIAMDALRNPRMVEAARTEATRLIEEDVSLSKYPLLKKEVDSKKEDLHFE